MPKPHLTPESSSVSKQQTSGDSTVQTGCNSSLVSSDLGSCDPVNKRESCGDDRERRCESADNRRPESESGYPERNANLRVKIKRRRHEADQDRHCRDKK